MRDGMQHWTREFSVGELISMAHGGEIALPDFQRDFVWDPSQVVELLDSVSNGWPIGSLLILEGPQPFNYRAIEDAPEASPETIRSYLLDGQQRVTALFHALTARGDTVFYVELTDESDDGFPMLRWEPRKRFDRRQATRDILQLAEMVSDRAFELRRGELPSNMAMRLDAVRARWLGPIVRDRYRIPAIVMGNDIELEALTRIFETLNRTGVRLNAFDLMVAVLRPSDFLLREEWELARGENPILDEMSVDGLEVLKLIALWRRDIDREESSRPASRRVRGIRQRDVLNIPGNYVKEMWGPALEAYCAALHFLRDRVGVIDGSGMPSWAMVLTIAYYIRRQESGQAIEKWYWSSIVTQSYSQGANTQVLTDVDRGASAHMSPNDVLSLLRVSLADSARRNRILRMGMRGLLVVSGARDVLTGDRLRPPLDELSTASARENKHSRRPDERIIDLAVANAVAVRQTKARLRSGSHNIEFASDALWSQGFDFGARRDEGVSYRIEWIAKNLEKKL